MMEVIKITADKKMYRLCSEEIKDNYEFVRFMVEKFKDDKKFIIEIPTNYLNKTNKEDIKYKELIFLMRKLLDNDRNNFEMHSLPFYIQRSLIYTE